MNSIKISLDVGGKKFELAYDTPDVVGEIPATDLNTLWLDEHMRTALRPVVGRLVLARRAEIAPVVVKAAKPATAGAL